MVAFKDPSGEVVVEVDGYWEIEHGWDGEVFVPVGGFFEHDDVVYEFRANASMVGWDDWELEWDGGEVYISDDHRPLVGYDNVFNVPLSLIESAEVYVSPFDSETFDAEATCSSCGLVKGEKADINNPTKVFVTGNPRFGKYLCINCLSADVYKHTQKMSGIPSEWRAEDEIYGVCPYCGYDAEAAVVYQSKQNNETLTPDQIHDEVEFYLYESHPDFCEGMRNSLKESETFGAGPGILTKEEYDALMGQFDSMTINELYMVRHQLHLRLIQLGMNPHKYEAETFEAYNPEQPRDERGRWIADEEEDGQTFIIGDEEWRILPAYGSKITLRELSEAVMETTHNHLDFDTAHQIVNKMLSQHPAGDSQEARTALLLTLEETRMQLEYADEIGWDMDIEIMAGLLRSRGIQPPEELEEAVINRLAFEDEWAAEGRPVFYDMGLGGIDTGSPLVEYEYNTCPKCEGRLKRGPQGMNSVNHYSFGEIKPKNQLQINEGYCGDCNTYFEKVAIGNIQNFAAEALYYIETRNLGQYTRFCPICDETGWMVQQHSDSVDWSCSACGHQWHDWRAEETVGYDKPLGESLNWTPYEYGDSKKNKPNKPTPAKDFDMGDTFGRSVLLMSEEEDEPELKKYMVGVPCLHSYAVGPVEAYDEEDAEYEVRNNWGYWRRTIQGNGDWGGPIWRYRGITLDEPEAYETFESNNYECISCGLTFAQEDTRDIDGDIVCDDCVYEIYQSDWPSFD